MNSSQQYHIAGDVEFDGFRKKSEDEDGWEEVFKNEETRVTTKKSADAAIYPVRVTTVFKTIESTTLYDILHDHEYRAVWDTNMIEGKVIELLDPRNEIGYYSCRTPMGISNRDFLNQRSWRAQPHTGEWIIMNHSVAHSACPENPNFVRAQSICTGYLILKRDDGGCKFTYFTQSDPKGWIPAWVMNNITSTFAPKMVEKLEAAARAYPEWKAKHNPNHKPWLQ